MNIKRPIDNNITQITKISTPTFQVINRLISNEKRFSIENSTD